MLNIKKMTYTGSRHISQGRQCQDYSFSCKMNGVSAVALADGAGSALRASDGAMVAAKTVCIYICENFDRLYDSENTDKEKFFIIEAVRYELEKKYSAENFEDFNSTIICTALSGDKCIVIHLGDGVVGGMNSSDGVFSVISAPVNGLTKRETYLTGMKNAHMYMKLYRLSTEKMKALILLTDGIASEVFNLSAGKQHDSVNTDMLLGNNCDGYIQSLYSGDDDYSYAIIQCEGEDA